MIGHIWIGGNSSPGQQIMIQDPSDTIKMHVADNHTKEVDKATTYDTDP